MSRQISLRPSQIAELAAIIAKPGTKGNAAAQLLLLSEEFETVVEKTGLSKGTVYNIKLKLKPLVDWTNSHEKSHLTSEKSETSETSEFQKAHQEATTPIARSKSPSSPSSQGTPQVPQVTSQEMRSELESDLVVMRSQLGGRSDRRRTRTDPQPDRDETDEDEEEEEDEAPPPQDLRGNVLEIKGLPIDRRVQINPKVLVMYDWFVEKYKYQGDLSDFLNDAVEDFFRSRGYSLKLVKEERLE